MPQSLGTLTDGRGSGTVALERSAGLGTRAFEVIRQLIVDGRIEAGQRLNEVDLAESLGVSRAPIRESIQRLVSEGLVQLIPHRGAFVREFTSTELIELYEVRDAIETKAAGLAAERARRTDVDMLYELLDATGSLMPDEGGSPYPSGLDFHRMVLVASGNSHLLKCGSDVQVKVRLARLRSGQEPARARVAYHEHRGIVSAIAAGDAAEATASMRAHLAHSLVHARGIVVGGPSGVAEADGG
jgi:DNA-binding GntR family transcriptional regulator